MASVLVTELESLLARGATAVEAEAQRVLAYLKEEAAKLEADLMVAKTLLESHGFVVSAVQETATAVS